MVTTTRTKWSKRNKKNNNKNLQFIALLSLILSEHNVRNRKTISKRT